MKVETINRTDYANIYGIFDETGKPIGTVEQRLAGRDVGVYYFSLWHKYTRKDIKRFFADATA